MMSKEKKPLIVYYSWSGNTKAIAQMIQELTTGDIYQLETRNPYPTDYNQTVDVAKQELRANTRPEFIEQNINIDNYDVIYLGYPNWWGTMPMVVYTFLESQDLSGKTIIPFCTHGGGGTGKSVKEIAICCPKATVGNVLSIYGRRKAKNAIENWLKSQKV